MEDGRAYLRELAAALAAAEAPRELRVEIVRRRFRGERMLQHDPLWRLGALCLDAHGALYATGEVLIVKAPTHPNYRSEVALRRNALCALAQRSGIPLGTTILLYAVPLDLDAPAAPLVPLDGGELGVQWMRGATPTPLRAYLDERAELLMHPLPGSTDEP